MNRTTSALLLALLLPFAGIVARAGEASTTVPPRTGVGEDLILVVAGQVPAAGALTELGRVNRAFAEVEGFTMDSAESYAVNGVHVQTSPDLLEVACPKPGRLFEKIVERAPLDLECPSDGSALKLSRPVALVYVARSQFASYRFPAPCGGIGDPPCQRDRYRQILGDDLGFRPGSTLLLTAFRTRTGAQEFLDLARTFGLHGLVVVNARKLGGGSVGLGQEPHPDGSGPLVGPLSDQTSYQR